MKMYSICFLILVSIFGSSIYCQSCLDTQTNCIFSPVCCVKLLIPKQIPRTGGVIYFNTNFSLNAIIGFNLNAFSLRLDSSISDSSGNHIEDIFVCNNISIDITSQSWICDIKKDADSPRNGNETIQDLYLINQHFCCRIKLILSDFAPIYARDPKIDYVPNYLFEEHTGYIDITFSSCPNQYYIDYTEFTLSGLPLQTSVLKDRYIGNRCTFSVKVSDALSSTQNVITLVAKIRNRPLPTRITIQIRRKPFIQDFLWTTFQELSLNLEIKGTDFNSLYQPHYELTPNVGYVNYVIKYEIFCTPCKVISNNLMKCESPIFYGELFHETYRVRISSHGKRITAYHDLAIKYLPAPVILTAWLHNDTNRIMEIHYNNIDATYPLPVIEIVHLKRNVYAHRIECIDVYVKYEESTLSCLLKEDMTKNFRWWVEMTIGNYKLNRYCLSRCDPDLSDLSQSDLLTYILLGILLVILAPLCLYIYCKFKLKHRATYKHKQPNHGPANITSLVVSFFNRKSRDNAAKELQLTRSKASQLITKRLRERALSRKL